MGKYSEVNRGTNYHGEKVRVEVRHGQGKAVINKEVLVICSKDVPRREPLLEGGSSYFRQLDAA